MNEKDDVQDVSFFTKQIIRDRILTLLRNQKEEERISKSLMIHEKLFHLQEFKEAKTILFYLAFDGEVDTFEMIKEAQTLGKRTGAPKINKHTKQIIPLCVEHLEDLEIGPYGIKEPSEQRGRFLKKENIDMVIVPGVAFDKKNNRLGRGGGYYDRFLKTLSSDIPTVGLAFDFQMLDAVPHQEGHDVRVSRVLVN